MVRLIFGIIWGVTARPLPRSVGRRYKRLLLRMFGAKVSKYVQVYSSAKIYYPRNLVMEGRSTIGPDTTIYNVDIITIKDGAVVSQGAHLCTASHDISDPNNHLISAPIVLEERSWVAADAFVGMGVRIGQGAVVGARAAVFKDVEAWTVVGGNPAKVIKKRVMKESCCEIEK
ncbi:MAG: putative colanic acid biosynthesis acetyltransferase [Bacteroidaceae bacterium]|nr:putative colanic acid biosynthesis acetyltransferase [Bacteroidaceae bacterium]